MSNAWFSPLPLVIVTAILNMEILAVSLFTVWFNGTKVNGSKGV